MRLENIGTRMMLIVQMSAENKEFMTKLLNDKIIERG
jgi:hypothetical protein